MAGEPGGQELGAELQWKTRWIVWREYELVRAGAADFIKVADHLAGNEWYDPVTRPTLTEELAALADGSEQAILDFVRRNGLLVDSSGREDTRLYRYESRKIRGMLALQHALQEASGSDESQRLEDFIVGLVGPDTYQELRSPKEEREWIKATWREHSPLVVALKSMAGGPVNDLVLRLYGFEPDPGGSPPALPSGWDRQTPGAVARFLLADLLNAPRGQDIYSPGTFGVPVTHLVETQPGALRRRASFKSLLDAIYWMLQGEVTGAKAVGVCRECGRYFVVRDARQKFCPPPAGDPATQSLCGNRYRMRQRRRAEKGGDQ